MHDLRVWPGVVADGSDSSTTPGKAKTNDQMDRLSKVSHDDDDDDCSDGGNMVILMTV